MRTTILLAVASLVACGGGSVAVPAKDALDLFDGDIQGHTRFLGADTSSPGLVDALVDPGKKSRPSVQRSAIDEEVEIITEDGARIFGRFQTPGGLAPYPAVLLIHQYGKDHSQWEPWTGGMEQPRRAEDAGVHKEVSADVEGSPGDVTPEGAANSAGNSDGDDAFSVPDGDAAGGNNVHEDAAGASPRAEIETLISRGFAVLAIDLRGHGLSDPYPKGMALRVDPRGTPRDVQAALSWLHAQQAIHPQRIAVMGTSIGANLVYLVMAQRLARAGVAISARSQSIASLFALDDLDEVTFGPVFCIAGEVDSSGAQKKTCTELSSATEAPNLVKILEASSDHGEALLANNPQIWSEILSYLQDNTASP
jgi:alpha/beta superfamily hydrolase